ncbi:hypothetical protein [Sorangium sp. So ce1078]|uniref:hypothetical protein n=1 Tax=Sorangium sp. So ce1078 TaxID=3133329 RepID=UPI003F5D7349
MRLRSYGRYGINHPWPGTIELYDPESGSWTLDRSFGLQRSGPSVAPLPDGRVLFLGGCTFDEISSLCTHEVESLAYAPGAVSPGDGLCELGVCVAPGAGGAGGGGPSAGGGGGCSTALPATTGGAAPWLLLTALIGSWRVRRRALRGTSVSRP